MSVKNPICNYAGQTKELQSGDRIAQTHLLRGIVAGPGGYYTDVDTILPVWLATDGAITITKVALSCDADPTTELDLDLKFADAVIGLANATLIDQCDTANGVFSATSGFNDATVPSGKCLYFSFGSEPDADITFIAFEIHYTYDN